MVTLKFYGDESADETNSRVFSVAGVIGTEDEWAEAMRLEKRDALAKKTDVAAGATS
jgi:hypothetical protein